MVAKLYIVYTTYYALSTILRMYIETSFTLTASLHVTQYNYLHFVVEETETQRFNNWYKLHNQ